MTRELKVPTSQETKDVIARSYDPIPPPMGHTRVSVIMLEDDTCAVQLETGIYIMLLAPNEAEQMANGLMQMARKADEINKSKPPR